MEFEKAIKVNEKNEQRKRARDLKQRARETEKSTLGEWNKSIPTGSKS